MDDIDAGVRAGTVRAGRGEVDQSRSPEESMAVEWVPVLRPPMKVAKAAVGKLRVARVGVLESRIATRMRSLAISTHELPSPGPE
jgi:hypothetical protein